jgi:hypothetical protein
VPLFFVVHDLNGAQVVFFCFGSCGHNSKEGAPITSQHILPWFLLLVIQVVCYNYFHFGLCGHNSEQGDLVVVKPMHLFQLA